MKSFFLFLVLAFFICSCKDSIVDPDDGGLLTSGGYIVNYNPDYRIVNKFIYNGIQSFLLGTDTINTDGYFRFVLPEPPEHMLRNIDSVYGYDGFNISDHNARVTGYVSFLISNGSIPYYGNLLRNNADTIAYAFEGLTTSSFAFTDRPVSLHGTNYIYWNIIGPNYDTIVTKINLNARKGWNMFNRKLVKMRESYTEYEISATDPNNMSWKLYRFEN